ncbi:hypothetical protein C1H76_6054 [Elsinoe australis]|uniref:Rhodopsin domain-containing protein n=1 Tax=Elsinoe australis TaxID=40998 RepID=A0A4U7AT93_9PEZI|nr:hypothetical protein C1H76_6054 [Elsinoe australis]
MSILNSTHYLPEIWTLFAAGSLVFTIRFFVRIKTSGLGLRGLDLDDAFAGGAWTFYFITVLLFDRAFRRGTNLDYEPSMTPSQLLSIVDGSKNEFAAWYTYASMIWSMKASMLFFYRRLTFNSVQQRMVLYIALALGTTYLAIILTISLSCRPFALSWAAPTTCSPNTNLITIATLNIIMSLAILSIPIPLLWKLQVPRKQKIAIGLFLTTGVVVILAAAIRLGVGLSLTQNTVNLNVWGVREALVGILFKNLPVLRQFFTRSFWTREGSSSGGTGMRGNSAVDKSGATRILSENEEEVERRKVHVQVEVIMANEEWEAGGVEMGTSSRVVR